MVAMRFAFSGGHEFTLKLSRFQSNVRDAAPAFDAMANVQQDAWISKFGSEGAYGGSRWAALSPEYASWKEANYPGQPILQLTGDLKRSLTQRPFGVEVIRSNGFVIGTAVPYATYHQKGTPGRMPARPLITNPTRRDAREFAKILQTWIVKGSV